jgi:murein DD-endopeptidase MepM/ murein hydrolase activator NlpD
VRVLTALLTLASPAHSFDLAWPVDCTLGDTCHIQQYPDHDPGPGATDFTCGPLSYDGHDGTDIALPDRAAMAAGVSILAAAPGTVKGIRDGIADFVPKIPGKECGNGVVIQHEDGWETQYCHMRMGSVVVKPGDIVATGTKLGLIGQSGMADFPHVHLSVRHNGAKLDPFAPDTITCSLTPPQGLWANPPIYEPGGFLTAGFTPAVPDYDAIRAGLPTTPMPGNAPGLVLWAYAFGTRTGDVMSFTITGPNGEILNEQATLEKNQAQMFQAMGKRLKAAAWPPGTYQGLVTLTRDNAEIDRITVTVPVQP